MKGEEGKLKNGEEEESRLRLLLLGEGNIIPSAFWGMYICMYISMYVYLVQIIKVNS